MSSILQSVIQSVIRGILASLFALCVILVGSAAYADDAPDGNADIAAQFR